MANLSDIITPSNILTDSNTKTVTNKTISGADNTLSNINLASQITGTLPVANGGTGTTSTTFANLTTNVTGTLPVANGGTGATTLTANNVLLGNGTSAPQVVAPSTSGNVLTSNGTTWQSTAPAGGVGAAKAYLSTIGSGTPAIEGSFNITSITDEEVGRISVTLDTDFANVTYTILVSSYGNSPTTQGVNSSIDRNNYNKTAGSFNIWTFNSSGTLADPNTGINVVCFGDQ